ncbi:protein obstructor-E isoform X1 [Homalodisca vitripennis]|uniref:protein obstructor-E isoform X1 n=1 Tax=Homalodisca vitripennis TaxID=197043 RepID=UPI001EEA9495|nr:protein obstructor-E isoform X1 [Homalodisca vitripennis]
MISRLIVVVVFAAYACAQKEDFKCPDDYGFYPHIQSCDKYWKCDNGVAELKTCGNGLAFDDTDPKYLKENCDYLHNVECGERTQLEPPIGTPNCPRLYGIFPDEVKCDTFWNCWNGEASRYQCSPGLAYDRDSRVCMWADQVPECKLEEVADGFGCPAAGSVANSAGSFSRHAHPDDCRKYYICMEGTAREYGCPIGTVFKIGDADGTGNCEDPEDVPGCEDYYGDLDLKSIRKSELLAGLGGTARSSAGPPKPVTKSQPRPQAQSPRPSTAQSPRPSSSKDFDDSA